MISSAPNPTLYLGMWSLYPLLVPFYLMGKTQHIGTHKFTSGVPQIADYYLMCVMGFVFTTLPFRLSRPAIAVAGALFCFVAYTAFINLVWSTNLENPSPLKSTLFYAYDSLLFLTSLILFAVFKEQFLKVTVYAVLASVVLQALLSPLAPQGGFSRQALFFNDENQLGYFCLLAATIFVLGARHFDIPTPCQVVFWCALGYLALVSQCRAALLALAILMLVALLGRPVRFLLALGGLAAVYFAMTVQPSLLSKSEERLVAVGGYDTLATRGYDRILNHPEYLLFGAGEGAYERFQSELYASEIHSSYGTLLFCYGIFGTSIFAIVLLMIGRQDPKSMLYLIPVFVYGSAHHGLRFAFFWAMLAVLCCTALKAANRGRLGLAASADDHVGRQEDFDPAACGVS